MSGHIIFFVTPINKVEGAGLLEKRSEILTEPEHQHEQLAEEVQLHNTPLTLPKRKWGKSAKTFLSI